MIAKRLPLRMIIAALIACAAAPAGAVAPAGRFDRQAWQQDLAQLRAELERAYVNLAWMGAPESGVDVPRLWRRAQASLAAATDDEEARRAIRAFVAGFEDGHFSELPAQSRSAPAEPEPAPPALDADDPKSGCAALGFASTAPVAFSLPFERLPGFRLLSDGLAAPFRAGLAPLPDGRTIGVIRIQNFRPTPFPAVCLDAWNSLRSNGAAVTAEAIAEAAERGWFAALARQLGALRTLGSAAVIVDIGTNSGGNDSGDWTARLVTNRAVASARMAAVDAPIAARYFDEQIAELDAVRPAARDAEARAAVDRARAFFARRKAAIGKARCDLSWVWRERRTWDPDACNRTIDSGFASGFAAGLPRGAYGSSEVASRISWPSRIEAHFGAWTGPVYVLINGRSYSSAEMFAAVMQDNRIGRLIGEKSGGDGCGFMVEAEPLVLAHSRLRFRLPNCMRLRADGSNEVAGVTPDLPLPQIEGESTRARAARALRLIGDDLGAAPPR
ncbi:hypothetical protein E2493_18730 [Sphingomonas parva]|uniref:Tail specific protease domain-containing protein n=1 Tax=Sphingomonas parva TaxID=2555898 RepID=A0A4Y8ZNI3_9SPHN|nr:S41 family peptidase [Sphingomonas parva]TFI56715.1 hypothetical protein E2493_18730 [Sphingomonas parva]